MARPEASLLLLFYLSVSSGQRDCTGVDCPQLDNCMEEVLDNGACCASCVQKGCTCEGYQYYDCVNAGFQNGKVPEGDSYFVDYGSTECSCPLGGGRISCQFISCPDLPANCIDVLEPTDGCAQCQRVGCLHEGQKYEAGHSFHADPCWLCHCPDEGGDVMCSRVACDSQEAYEATEDKIPGRRDSYPHGFDPNQFSTASRDPLNGRLPLFKSPPSDKESEDYDYTPVDFSDLFPPFLVPPTVSSTSSKKVPPASQDSSRPDGGPAFPSVDVPVKMELREQYGVHDHPKQREEATQSPLSVGPTSPHASWQISQGVSFGDSSPHPDSFNVQRSPGSVMFPLNVSGKYLDVESESGIHHQRDGGTKTSDGVTLGASTDHINLTHRMRGPEALSNQERGSGRVEFPLYMLRNAESPLPSQSRRNYPEELHELDNREMLEEEEGVDQEEDITTFQSVTEANGNNVPIGINPTPQSSNPTSSSETIPPDLSTASPSSLANWEAPENYVIPNTTTELPLWVKLDQSLSSGRLPHGGGREEVEKDQEGSHRQVSPFTPERDPGVSARDLLQDCCAAGQKWASENLHCKHMPELRDKRSVCRVAWKQCCLSAVKENRCESGVVSARAGHACEADEVHPCTDDSHQVCCSCCALGLWMRSEGQDCQASQHLNYPCSHIFLTCCEEEDDPDQLPLRRKEKPRPTAPPRRVSDRELQREGLSIRAPGEAVNAVEEQQDVDECELDRGKLCQHTCSNIWGSYRCGCHRGYILQDDGHSCAPVSPEEDNRVRAVNGPAVGPVQTSTTTTTASGTTSSPVHLDPCTGNGACSQQCRPAAGRAHCSCFPGFLLLADGRTCEDVDECVTNTHRCRPGERCVNTVGSFVCQRQVACPAGYRLNGGVCQDMDECAEGRDDCGEGFVCENTAGSFLCKPRNKCMSGFMQDSHGNCIDVNECRSLKQPCSSGSTCVNTVGSFTCQQKMVTCSHGYHVGPDGAKCVDIDECQMGAHRCGGGQICHNLPGSYRCDCQTGYQYDALRKTCTDVNECWRYSGRLCAQTCENTPGSYHCSCTAGFSLAADGNHCEDVNECEKNPCSQECANIYGSYQCYCRQGYFLKEDGHTCEDIDECSQNIMNLCTFQCINVAGSYQCTCPPHGYTLSANGRTCTDVDECSAGTHNCSSGQTCYNLQGGFRCLSFDCPHNYRKVSDTRCERMSCPANSLDCQNSPVQITYYQLRYQTNIIIPAQIFRIGPSPAYAGDHFVISITKGNEEGYFSTRKLNSFTGAVYLQRKVLQPKDFLIEVEMKLLRQGTLTSFLARIYVFITSNTV